MRATNRRNRGVVVAGGLLSALLLASLLIFLLNPARTTQRVLFFPTETGPTLRGEYRKIRLNGDRELDILEIVKELILGPVQLKLSRVLPRNAAVRSILLRDRVLYLDFTQDILFPHGPIDLDFDEMIEAVRRTVLHNFPWIRQIYMFVDKRMPKSETMDSAPTGSR